MRDNAPAPRQQRTWVSLLQNCKHHNKSAKRTEAEYPVSWAENAGQKRACKSGSYVLALSRSPLSVRTKNKTGRPTANARLAWHCQWACRCRVVSGGKGAACATTALAMTLCACVRNLRCTRWTTIAKRESKLIEIRHYWENLRSESWVTLPWCWLCRSLGPDVGCTRGGGTYSGRLSCELMMAFRRDNFFRILLPMIEKHPTF